MSNEQYLLLYAKLERLSERVNNLEHKAEVSGFDEYAAEVGFKPSDTTLISKSYEFLPPEPECPRPNYSYGVAGQTNVLFGREESYLWKCSVCGGGSTELNHKC